MGLLDFFRKPPSSAGVAKERLRIIVAQERSAWDAEHLCEQPYDTGKVRQLFEASNRLLQAA